MLPRHRRKGHVHGRIALEVLVVGLLDEFGRTERDELGVRPDSGSLCPFDLVDEMLTAP